MTANQSMTFQNFDPRYIEGRRYALVVDANAVPDEFFDELFKLTTGTDFISFESQGSVMMWFADEVFDLGWFTDMLFSWSMTYGEGFTLFFGPIVVPISEPLQKLKNLTPASAS